MKLNCEDLMKYLSDYIDNHLDEDLSEAAREHLASCHNCSVVLDSTQQMILLYRERGQSQRIPAGRQQALYDRIASAFAQRDDNCE
jgi:hypothetical protein